MGKNAALEAMLAQRAGKPKPDALNAMLAKRAGAAQPAAVTTPTNATAPCYLTPLDRSRRRSFELRRRRETLTPEEWEAMLASEGPKHVLDVRNGYEWDVGRFAGAERPAPSQFSESTGQSFGLPDDPAECKDVPVMAILKEFRAMAEGVRGRKAHRPAEVPKYEYEKCRAPIKVDE